MSTAKVIPFQPRQTTSEVSGARVADCEDGYTRIANELLEAVLSAELTARQLKIVMAVIRKTYGFNKKSDRITNTQIADITGIHHTHVCKAKNELLERKILITNGREIGVNKVVSEWKNEISQNSKTLAKSANKTLAKSAKQSVPSQLNTKGTLKDNKEKTPLPPCGGSQSADAELPAAEHKKTIRKKSPAIDYQAFADAYNETLGDQLPNCAVMNDKRKRALKKLLGLLLEPTVECFTAYLRGFAKRAGPFYFGDNDRGWMASIDYLLCEDTLTKTKEGSLLGGLTGEDDE